MTSAVAAVASTLRRSPPALAILGLLEAGPLHPYGIQRLLKDWGKDKVVNVGQRASLYRIIARLDKAGLISAGGTDRDERYPERTRYHVTDAGRAASREWLAEILSTPRNDFPEFPAGLSFLMMLIPRTVQELLDQRRAALQRRTAELDAELATEIEGRRLPRVALVDCEYLRAVTSAELRWVSEILDALRDESFRWAPADLEGFAGDGQPS